MMKYTSPLIVILALLLCSSAQAQDAAIAAEPPEGVDWLVIPTFKYNDDAGFQYGAQLAVIEHARGVSPHVWDMRLRLEHSTRNRHDHRLILDAPHLLGGGLRLFVQVDVLHIDDANYFGVGAQSVNTGDQTFHSHRLTEPRGRVIAQRALGEHFFAGGGIEYAYTLTDAAPGSLLARDRPTGWEGGQTAQGILSAGFDNRRSAILPKDAYVGELYLKGASSALGSDFSFATAGMTHQGYWAPWEWLVLAQRVIVERQLGEVPFYELVRVGGTVSFRGVGGVLSQRGFLEGRFLGRGRALSSSELRAYLPLLWGGLLLGGGPFLDVSRVSGGGALWEDWQPSGGLEVSVGWKDSFLFRMDYAISDEDRLFYITGRHMF